MPERNSWRRRDGRRPPDTCGVARRWPCSSSGPTRCLRFPRVFPTLDLLVGSHPLLGSTTGPYSISAWARTAGSRATDAEFRPIRSISAANSSSSTGLSRIGFHSYSLTTVKRGGRSVFDGTRNWHSGHAGETCPPCCGDDCSLDRGVVVSADLERLARDRHPQKPGIQR